MPNAATYSRTVTGPNVALHVGCGRTTHANGAWDTPNYSATVPLAVGKKGDPGKCTWWALDQLHRYTGLWARLVPGPNASGWAMQAASTGWTVSAFPMPHSILVQPNANHVAWVEAVSASTIISEMNHLGLYKTDERWIPMKDSSYRYIAAST